MVAIRSTFAVDTGLRLGARFWDVRWMSQPGTPSDRRWFANGEILPDDHGPVWGYGSVDDAGRLVINYEHPDLFDEENPFLSLWFTLIDRRTYQPAHFILLGFANDAFPPGTVVEAPEAASLFDDDFMSSWAGLVNWRSGDPMLQQVTTAESWRRRRVAVTMLMACDIVNACYGFSPGKVLHGGAVTTENGETLRHVFPGSPSRIDGRMGSVSRLD